VVEKNQKIRKKSKEIIDWENDDLLEWLEKANLRQYVDTFRENAIDGRIFLTLTDQQLVTNFNITNEFHRKKIRNQQADSLHPDAPRSVNIPQHSHGLIWTYGLRNHICDRCQLVDFLGFYRCSNCDFDFCRYCYQTVSENKSENETKLQVEEKKDETKLENKYEMEEKKNYNQYF